MRETGIISVVLAVTAFLAAALDSFLVAIVPYLIGLYGLIGLVMFYKFLGAVFRKRWGWALWFMAMGMVSSVFVMGYSVILLMPQESLLITGTYFRLSTITFVALFLGREVGLELERRRMRPVKEAARLSERMEVVQRRVIRERHLEERMRQEGKLGVFPLGPNDTFLPPNGN